MTDTLTGNRPLLPLLLPALPRCSCCSCCHCCFFHLLLCQAAAGQQAAPAHILPPCRRGPALPLPAGEQLLRQRFLLRTRQQFEEATGLPAPTGKQYFQVRLAGAALPELSCTVLPGLAVLHAATNGAAATTWPRPALASSFLPPLSLPWLCSALTCGMLHVLHFLALL